MFIFFGYANITNTTYNLSIGCIWCKDSLIHHPWAQVHAFCHGGSIAQLAQSRVRRPSFGGSSASKSGSYFHPHICDEQVGKHFPVLRRGGNLSVFLMCTSTFPCLNFKGAKSKAYFWAFQTEFSLKPCTSWSDSVRPVSDLMVFHSGWAGWPTSEMTGIQQW